MESQIFNSMGLGNLDPAILFFVLIGALLIMIIVSIVQTSRVKKLEKRYNKFMQGKEAESLEDEIVGLFHDNRLIRTENEKNRKDIQDINKRMQKTFQKIGLEK